MTKERFRLVMTICAVLLTFFVFVIMMMIIVEINGPLL